MPWWNRGGCFCLFLIAATLLAYFPVWHAGFLWDDNILLTDNPLIKAPDGWWRFWCTSKTPDYFPMTSTSFWLEWRLWGMNAAGYHLTNVLLHAANALLLWRVLTRLNLPGARLAAMIFALHPVTVASVAWIAERKNTLAMFFLLLTLIGYLKFDDTGRRRWYWISLIAFVFALLSKTAAAPLPLVLLGIVWWRHGFLDWKDVLRSAAFFGAAAVLALITIKFQYHNAIGHDIVRTDDFWSRLAIAGRAAWFYFYKALVPVALLPVYPRWETGSVDVFSFGPGLLWAAVFVVCWRYRTQWGRAPLFGLGCFVAMLLPVLGFLNIYFFRYSLVADHWQYFAIVGIIALAAAGIARLPDLFPQGKLLFCGALLLTLGDLTWRQAGIYRDAETFWRATLVGNPASAVANDGLGYILFENGKADEALGYFQKALQADPAFAQVHYNLGRLYFQKGDMDGAIAQFQQALQINPRYAPAHNNLGGALLKKGDVDEAIPEFQAALQINPDNAQARYNFGNALVIKGDPAGAISQFQRALQIDPDYAEADYDLGVVLAKNGRPDEAIAQFQKTLQLNPDNADACYDLAILLVQKGRTDEAIAQFQKTVQINPGNADAYYNLGVLLQPTNLAKAIAQFQKVLQIDPGQENAYNELGGALLQSGNVAEAITNFQKALQIKPDDIKAQNNLAWVLATTPQSSLRDGNRAVELARQANELSGGQNPVILHTLAAALAGAGRFGDAVDTAQKAANLARQAGQSDLASQLDDDLKHYAAGLPLHQ